MVVRPLRAVVLLGAAGAALAWILGRQMSAAVSRGMMLGILLAAAGAAAGLVLTAWSFEKGQRQFLGALVLGILARLAAYGAVLVYVALRTEIDPVATAGALLAFYLLFLILEVRFAVGGLARRPAGEDGRS